MNTSYDIYGPLIKKSGLPDSFVDIIHEIYIPLSDAILNQKAEQPLIVSINGAQGTGKSTLTGFLKFIIESKLGGGVVKLSLDDFYYTRRERKRLARDIHPLLMTRGVPGTHDLNLLEGAIDALVRGKSCRMPVFNKAIDDRVGESDWTEQREQAQVILFEGWCNNSPVQKADELAEAINELEAEEDAERVWRSYANEKLAEYHKRLFDRSDMCIMLDAQKFEHVHQWRALQEKKLAESSSSRDGEKIMDEKALRRFIQHYERITRYSLLKLPEKADIVMPVAVDQSITGIVNKQAT